MHLSHWKTLLSSQGFDKDDQNSFIAVWDLNKMQCIQKLEMKQEDMSMNVFENMVACKDGSVIIWDFKDQTPILQAEIRAFKNAIVNSC